MSTRAIIGIQNNDGSIKGGWQWNDGMNLKPLLKSQFDTIEKVNELISIQKARKIFENTRYCKQPQWND